MKGNVLSQVQQGSGLSMKGMCSANGSARQWWLDFCCSRAVTTRKQANCRGTSSLLQSSEWHCIHNGVVEVVIDFGK
jgi:hypothetical protein